MPERGGRNSASGRVGCNAIHGASHDGPGEIGRRAGDQPAEKPIDHPDRQKVVRHPQCAPG